MSDTNNPKSTTPIAVTKNSTHHHHHQNNNRKSSLTTGTIETSKFNNPKFDHINNPLEAYCNTKTNPGEEGSLFFYHHEPIQYMPNYDTVHQIPGKYNTIGPSTKHGGSGGTVAGDDRHHDIDVDPRSQKFELNKYYSSTCNLKQHQPLQHHQPSHQQQHAYHKTSSNTMIDGQYFSNSLINFNYPASLNYHQFVDATDASNAPYLQFQNADGELALLDGAGMYGSKHHIGASGGAGGSGKLHSHMHHGDSQNHLQQVNGSNSNIPWRHRQCPSVGSSSSSTSIASKFRSKILSI